MMSSIGKSNSNLALFIDFENVERDRFDVVRLIESMQRRGRLLVNRAYADWGRFSASKHQMIRAGVDVVELPANARGKNRADIRLVVDAMELALTRDYIETYVIVSGDSDFLPLVSKLRELNRYVIVIAQRSNACPLFERFCDEVLYIESSHKAKADSELGIGVAVELVTRAVEQLSAKGVAANLSAVKSKILELDPEFDESKFNVHQFKGLVKLLEAKGVVKLRTRSKNDIRVELTASDDSTKAPRAKPGTSKSRSLPIVSGAKSVDYVDDQILDRLYWANKLRNQPSDSPARLSVLGAKMRRLYPTFELRSFGFPKQGAWTLLASLLEKHQYCRVLPMEKGCQVIEFTPLLLDRQAIDAKPDRFDEMMSEMIARFHPVSTVVASKAFDDRQLEEMDHLEDAGTLIQSKLPF